MKRIWERIQVVMMSVAAVLCGLAIPAVARAEGASFAITPPTFDMAGLGTYAGVILGALAALWMIRKYIKTTNRS